MGQLNDVVHVLQGREKYIEIEGRIYLSIDDLANSIATHILDFAPIENRDINFGHQQGLRWLREDLEKVKTMTRKNERRL